MMYAREQTPLLYYISPAVVYYGELASFYVDPKNTLYNKKATELPIIEARIDGHVIDFEGFIDESVVYSYGVKN